MREPLVETGVRAGKEKALHAPGNRHRAAPEPARGSRGVPPAQGSGRRLATAAGMAVWEERVAGTALAGEGQGPVNPPQGLEGQLRIAARLP